MSPQQAKQKQADRGGRPTKYTPKRCEEIYRLMAKGYSIGAAAGAMGLERQTLYNWKKRHPQFAYALGQGEAARVLFLERMLFGAKDMTQVRLAIRLLKHAAPEEYSPEK